jgi:hypothetical protein
MTGVIVFGIIAIWLIVLVPMWLNRHEAADANRSMDNFSTAMRVLSRRPSAGDRRYVVMPRRQDWGPTVDNHPHADLTARPRARRPLDGGAAGRARLVARRRRFLAAIGSLVFVVAVVAALGIGSWWYELAVCLAAAGYVVHLRNEAIRARELRRRREARMARLAEEPQAAYAPAPARARVRDSFIAADDVLAAPAVSATGTENGSRWEPVPVPLPTYVSKPVARPAARGATAAAAAAAARVDVDATATIDLTRPGEWSESIDHRHLLLDETGSGRIAASPAVSARAAAAEVEDDELDVILRRRAVGD